MGLPGLILALGPDHVLYTGHLQQVSEFCRVEHVAGLDGQRLAGLLIERNGRDEIPFDLSCDGPVAEQHPQPASGAVGSEHPLEDGEGHTGLMAETTHQPVSGIEVFPVAGFGSEGIVAPVEIPYSVPQAAVARRAAHLLDPGMLVRRDPWAVSWPPIQSVSSVSTTLRPRRNAARAPATPPSPPPTIRTSVSVSKGGYPSPRIPVCPRSLYSKVPSFPECSLLQPVAPDDVRVPAGARLGDAALSSVLHEYPEPLGVPFGPLEVIQERPDHVTAQVDALLHCLVGSPEVGVQVKTRSSSSTSPSGSM